MNISEDEQTSEYPVFLCICLKTNLDLDLPLRLWYHENHSVWISLCHSETVFCCVCMDRLYSFLFFSFFFLAAPVAYESSLARDGIQAITAVTWVLNPLYCTEPGIELELPQRQCWIVNPLCHSGNSRLCNLYFGSSSTVS